MTNKPPKGSLAAIDGDIICYTLGFAGQTARVYAIENGTKYLGNFKNRTQANEYITSDGVVDFIDYYIPDKVANVLHSVDVFIEHKFKQSGCEKYCIFLDGPGNFREEVATILPYKGNRTQDKPVYYHLIRNHILSKHPHRIIVNMEADDALSVMQHKGYKEDKLIVSCTIDKDAKNVEGWLYNWDKMDAPTFITPLEAMRNFYTQVLVGDTVDNYQGCRGVGKAGAAVKKVNELSNEFDIWDVVIEEFRNTELKAVQHREEGKGKYAEHDPRVPEIEALENARLAYMHRVPPKFDEDGAILEEYQWQPPHKRKDVTDYWSYDV